MINGPACGDHFFPVGQDIVVIRMTAPWTETKSTIVRHYAEILQDRRDLWVLFDTHTIREYPDLEQTLRHFQQESPYPFSFFLHNREMMNRIFPTAAQHLKKFQVNYLVHVASTIAFWRICGEHNFNDPLTDSNGGSGNSVLNPKAMWVLEADAGFSGDVNTFFDFYDDKDYDLIAAFQPDPLSQYYMAHVRQRTHDSLDLPDSVYYGKWDHVTRVSSRLLYHVDALIKAGVVLLGEVFESTVCLGFYPDWCTYHDFGDDGFKGWPHGVKTKITAEEWTTILATPEKADKWYHALLENKERSDRRLTIGFLMGGHELHAWL